MKPNRPPKRRTEVDIAGIVVAWLRDAGWTVYQEVRVGYLGRRIDIVAELDRRLWVIECKRTHSFDVVEQAMYWLGVAHWVSVATAGHLRRSAPQRRFHEMLGIGWLHVGYDDVEECVPAAMTRRVQLRRFLNLHDYLTEAQQTIGTAGSQFDYYTNFGDTKRRIVKLINEKPGITMKEIVSHGDGYHYRSSSTARASLAKWISKGVIPGIDSRRDGRTVRYYPVAPAASERRSPC